MSEFALYPSLKDRVVFITGGGSGIGASLVELFAAQGSRVAFIDCDRDASQRLVADLGRRSPARPRFFPGDLREIDVLRGAMAAAAAALGPSASW